MISKGWKHIGGDVWETARIPGPNHTRKTKHAIFQRFVSINGKAVSLKFENTNPTNGEYEPGRPANFYKGQLHSIRAVHRYFQHQSDYQDLSFALFRALDQSQLEELLEDEQKGVFERGEVILAAASRGLESFTPRKETGTSAEDRARIDAFLEQAEAIRLWFEVHRPIIAETRNLGPIEFSKDMLSLDSKYRKSILELRKITDILELCRSPGPFISWAPERCWPSPVGVRTDKGYAIMSFGTAPEAVRFPLHSLQLVEKISKGVEKRAAQVMLDTFITVNKNNISIFKSAKGDELETSHLCHPSRGGSLACYNPAHLVPETRTQNMNRQRCLGTLWIDGIPHSACDHGKDGRDRCLGWRQNPIDTQLSQPERSYIPSYVSRDRHAELFAPLIASEQAALAAPAPAPAGRGSGRPTDLSRILDDA